MPASHDDADIPFTPPRTAVAQDVRRVLRHERAFLTRATIFMLDRGIRQFLDLGSGPPTTGGPHDTATYLGVTTRIVHVDSDPDVVEHGRSRDRHGSHFLRADAADVDHVLSTCESNGWIDLDEPVGVLAVGLLHLMPPRSCPRTVVPRYCAPLVGGSAAAITHLPLRCAGERTRQAERLLAGPGGSVHPCDHAEAVAMLADLDIVKPGVVPLPYRWVPGLFPADAPTAVEPVVVLAGLGVKR